MKFRILLRYQASNFDGATWGVHSPYTGIMDDLAPIPMPRRLRYGVSEPGLVCMADTYNLQAKRACQLWVKYSPMDAAVVNKAAAKIAPRRPTKISVNGSHKSAPTELAAK